MDEAKKPVGLNTVFECFGYELFYGGQQYILSSGNWYEVVKQFIAQTNNIANGIATPKAKLVLWKPGESERAYNLRCAEERGFLFFDARNVIFGGNHSKFEFCDFLDLKTKTLFFVKIPTQSSGMSHLVEQTRRTAELLFSVDDGYRKELKRSFISTTRMLMQAGSMRGQKTAHGRSVSSRLARTPCSFHSSRDGGGTTLRLRQHRQYRRTNCLALDHKSHKNLHNKMKRCAASSHYCTEVEYAWILSRGAETNFA